MIKSRKQMYVVIGAFALVLMLFTTTYAFFNYTRTGTSNTIRVGRIAFNSSQDGSINLTNAFPINSTQAQTDTTNAKSITITVTGDTDYSDGIEYLISASDVNNTVNGKKLPITLEVTVNGNGLGTAETGDYYTNRDGYTTSKYKVEYEGLAEESHILVGYIARNETLGTASGINGSITIKAYVDKDKILISDTLENGPIEVNGYTNGTRNSDNKIVFTTSEWNSIAGNNALSFKVRVEANEGVWVEKEATPRSCFIVETSKDYAINENMTQQEINMCVNYLTQIWGANNVDVGETYETFCAGTGTIFADTLIEKIYNGGFGKSTLNYFEENNIITSTENGAVITGYDENCETDVIIPRKIKYKPFHVNENMTQEELHSCSAYLVDKNYGTTEIETYELNTNNQSACVNYFENNGWVFDVGETASAFCDGTGTSWGSTFEEMMDDSYFDPSTINEFLNQNIITGPIIKDISDKYVDACNGIERFSFTDQWFEDIDFDKNDLEYFIQHNVIIEDREREEFVTRIGNNAFENKNLTSVFIPSSVVTIEENAFVGNYLSSVVLSNGITSIGDNAFKGNLVNSIIIPNSITSIGHNAFEYNHLTNVTIPNSVVTIGERAFSSNDLTTVVLGNSVESIGRHAFSGGYNYCTVMSCGGEGKSYNYNAISSVTIPASIEYMACNAFTNQGNGTINIQITYENPNFTCSS